LLQEGTFYLTYVDEKYRRYYDRKKPKGDRGVVRLQGINGHLTAQREYDASVMRSVVANFHKKPLRE